MANRLRRGLWVSWANTTVSKQPRNSSYQIINVVIVRKGNFLIVKNTIKTVTKLLMTALTVLFDDRDQKRNTLDYKHNWMV